MFNIIFIFFADGVVARNFNLIVTFVTYADIPTPVRYDMKLSFESVIFAYYTKCQKRLLNTINIEISFEFQFLIL